jgi:hypothetical protein
VGATPLYRSAANSEHIFSAPFFSFLFLCSSCSSATSSAAQGPSGVLSLLISALGRSGNDNGSNDFICGKYENCKQSDHQFVCPYEMAIHSHTSLDLYIMSFRAWNGGRNAIASDADAICWGNSSTRSQFICRSPERPFSLSGMSASEQTFIR